MGTPNVDPEEIVKTLSEQWDKVENKGNALLIGGGGLFALWLASTVVGAINSVPLLPKLMELVGFGYSAWFVYKYFLFKEGRIQAAADFEELKEDLGHWQVNRLILVANRKTGKLRVFPVDYKRKAFEKNDLQCGLPSEAFSDRGGACNHFPIFRVAAQVVSKARRQEFSSK